MNKRLVFLAGLGIVLATVYLTLFTDWLKPKKIQILWRIIPAGALGPSHPAVVSFLFKKPFPLTSVRVIEADDALTNKYPHALWDLVPVGLPPLTKSFNYGETIPGMAPKVPTARPDPLVPGDDYLVIVQAADNLKGEKSFSIHEQLSQN